MKRVEVSRVKQPGEVDASLFGLRDILTTNDLVKMEDERVDARTLFVREFISVVDFSFVRLLGRFFFFSPAMTERGVEIFKDFH